MSYDLYEKNVAYVSTGAYREYSKEGGKLSYYFYSFLLFFYSISFSLLDRVLL